MVLVERNLLFAAMAPAACVMVLAACGPSSGDDNQRKTQLSGPVGLEHSVHPVSPTQGRMAVAGCCSFVVEDAKVQRLEGDVDGRQIEGAGYRAIISFGNGVARPDEPQTPATVRQIDGVPFNKIVVKSARPGEPRLVYRATVPLDDQAKARNIANPGLEIVGWCSSELACDRLTKMIESIRF
jgi:hypothetical protein